MLPLNQSLEFLSQLRQNNNRDWFNANQASYEAALAEFSQFVAHLIDEFRLPDTLFALQAKDCIARIYRDIRFSKDKSPYKTNFGAYIARDGWKSNRLGYYLGIEPGGRSIVAGGWYAPSPAQLQRFRSAISADSTNLTAIVQAPSFVQNFGKLTGESLKSAPKGYDSQHANIEWLRLKQITVVHPFTDEQTLSDDFFPQVVNHCHAMRPFLDYLQSVP
ncbi:MAG TPA: DUF2461 domain-containing protein [Anaerolineales bacterium]|nr:DUF2461 domain-containing protein [Anaerolineales bacterium]